MIKLIKSPMPKVLENNGEGWKNTLLQKLRDGVEPSSTDRNRYSHKEIKIALIQETHGKCAYCESKIRHTSFGDIEHITPKSVVPEKWFDWNNLTLACSVCNNNKSDFHGDHESFIDPYEVEPENAYWFAGATVFARPGNEAAAITERLLKLNRGELVERRMERLEGLMRHLNVIEGTQDSDLRMLLLDDFEAECCADKEYAALAREVKRVADSKFNNNS